jgi:tetratricopeptide (TPR) repeat protein
MARALALCDAAVKQGSGRAKAGFLDSRGFALMRLGRFKEAIAAYDAALAIVPLLPTSLYGRGICELRMGNRKDAANDLRDGKLFSEGSIAADFKRYGVGP